MGFKTYQEAVAFHGHSCPGLSMGFRAAELALKELNISRAADEDLVAVVENSSCAVDAIQLLTGCTAGKGNLIINDLGKQVYSVIKRPSGKGIRIAVKWDGIAESEDDRRIWQQYMEGDRSESVVAAVAALKAKKTKAILAAPASDLFSFRVDMMELPSKAQIYPTVQCANCGEKVMQPKAGYIDGKYICEPCRQQHDKDR